MNLIQIALPVPLNRYFDYLLPAEMKALKGARVVVPFGNQKKIGIVVGFPETTDIPKDKLKPILSVLDEQSLFDDEILQLLKWSADYYHSPLGEVLQSALPVKLRQGESCERAVLEQFSVTEIGHKALLNGTLNRAKKQQQLLTELTQFANFFEKPTACSSSVWKALLEKGFVKKEKLSFESKTWLEKLGDNEQCNTSNKLRLNKQQALIVGRLQYQKGFGVFLLNGVTGSGKTEVYLQVIETVLEKGKQVLVLVPEIGLTPQTIARFKARFNVEIDTVHSNLNDTERLNVWLRAKNGENAIVIGTRSALFSQFKNLGLIIIDEEHDSSFKQQDGWRYNARDLAVLRAKNNDIPIILGSATPSLESVQNVQNGKFTELVLKNRAGDAQLAQQFVIDLKTQQIHSGLSQQLLSMMKTHLEQGNQVMLFLNRRGFAPVLLCHECGWICECRSCEKPYTYHQKKSVLRCHHCASQKIIPKQCGHCGSINLVTTGIGTEQLEQELIKRFNRYSVTRIDRDSTIRKGSLDKHLSDIQQGKSQILIGTQMLAKGHHFPNVTLVAIVNVDSALFSTDFRAEERLAQLYIQVAGRAGRAEKKGTVVLQTHYPEHPLLKSLLIKGYDEFTKTALEMRQLMSLPPFSAQVLFKATGRNNEKIANFLTDLTAYFQQQIAAHQWQGFQLLPPMAAPMAKKAGQYRWQLLIQHHSKAMLQQLLNQFDLDKNQLEIPSNIRLVLDVDPLDFS
ncbi:primosomal protein N' [Phocoenobacter skyensis]|uniref:Replication restart protein PriA n=1 Tax=Phocoenobacter skyensis TaxID=97481 RepID=A0AAJ6NE72_9PAST|nr:primosomal protein N' [Pasteurella skyensis]MDP8175183.1 primosomal protein N' [Pasteurella skyensis]